MSSATVVIGDFNWHVYLKKKKKKKKKKNITKHAYSNI